MQIYRVTFAGHRKLYDFASIAQKMECFILHLLQTKEFVESYVGNDGEFDALSTAVVRRIRKSFGEENSALYLILPYPNADLPILSQQFDSVLIPEPASKAHPKRAITERNRWMVDHCDLLICYTRHESGGAAQTVNYAMKSDHIQIVNLFGADEI